MCQRRPNQASNTKMWCWLYGDAAGEAHHLHSGRKVSGELTSSGLGSFPCHLLVIQSKAGDDFIHSFTLSFIHKIRIKHLVLWLRQHWKQAAFEGAEGRRSTSTHHNPSYRLCLPGGAQSWPNPSATWVLPIKGTEELQRGGSNGSGP